MDVTSLVRAQMMLLDIASAVASFAANWLVQSTLLIAAGLVIGRLLHARGSALQSAVYRTTLAAALACPLATSLLALGGVSGWSLEMPAAWTFEQVEPGGDDNADVAEAVGLQPVPAAELSAGDFRPIAAEPFSASAVGNEIAYAPQPLGESLLDGKAGERAGEQLAPAAAAAPAATSSGQAPPQTVKAPTFAFDVRLFGLAASGIAALWLTASAVLLLRLGRSARRLNQLRSDAAPAEPAAQHACRELAALLHVAAPEVLRSPYLASPCLAGLRRPAVLLPEADPTLPVRDVLIHELAHLRRRDGHWNLLRRLAEAAFFYQPLLWLLTRRMEVVAEEVCDDYVVQFGGDRERYARGLVEIAELSLVPAGAVSVGMVSLRSILAKRVLRIMDSSRSLSTRVGNLLLAVVIAAGLAGVTVTGLVGLGSPQSLAEGQASGDDAATTDNQTGVAPNGAEGKAPAAEPREKPAPEKEQANEQPGETKPAPENRLEGIVTGANGKPVAGAKLYWLRTRVPEIDPQPPRLLATTDKDGRYQFAEPPAVPAETPASWEYTDRIVIMAPGHGFKYTSAGELRRERGEAEGLVPTLARAVLGGRKGATSLPPAGDPIRGRLVDINGQPVAGARVRIRWFADEKDQLGGLEEAKARGVKNPVWQGRVGYLLNVIEPVQIREVLPSAVTDGDGKFELRDIGPKRLVQLLVEGDGIEATEIVARNEPGEKIVLDIDWIRPGKSVTVYPYEFLHAVGPAKPVTGRVLDLDSGEPIAGAVVRAFQVHGEPISTSREREHFAVRTDAEGRYRITGLPIGKENELVAFATGDVAYIPIGRDADTSAPGAELQVDFRLKRGVWAEGRVYDAETQKPFTGEISYYFFRDRKQEESIPGLKKAFIDGLYWTNFVTTASIGRRTASIASPVVSAPTRLPAAKTLAAEWHFRPGRLTSYRPTTNASPKFQ
jgi:beta-lactamase regulating signal transducer with metallopeptidase domain/protocatechuate 3,4-dioxygenase beta subunit